MRSRGAIVIAIIAIAAGIWIALSNRSTPPAPAKAPESRAAVPPPDTSTAAPAKEAEPPPFAPDPEVTAPVPRSAASRTASRRDLENPLVPAEPPGMPPPRLAEHADPEAAIDFGKVQLMLRDYRALTGENPIGTNQEIMEAIMGGNPKGAMLGPPEGQTVNENGELIDRWGTPYFFHQLSKDRMEIRSAGPDRRMWNEDDLSGG
jgi:hypothetical protein